MRARLTAALTACALVATGAGAGARVPEPRRDTVPYAPTDDNFYVGGPQLVVGTGDLKAQYWFPVEKGEKTVDVFIQDDTEMPVSGVVTQWRPVGGQSAGPASATTYERLVWERFCTRTEVPIPVYAKYDVRVLITEGTCEDGTPSVPTTGLIVVDFHRR